MFKWIEWIFYGHVHNWENHGVVEIYNDTNTAMAIGHKMRQQCSICRRFRRVTY